MKKSLIILCASLFVAFSVQALSYLDHAEYLADKKVIVRQRPTDNYGLSDKVLRQEVVGIAIRLTGLNFRGVESISLPDPYTCDNTFADVKQSKPNSWVCRSVEIAAKYGIISTSNENFRPEDAITRAEAIAMIMNAVKLLPKTDETKPWQESIMSTSRDLKILADDTLPADEDITRGELFYTVNHIIKVLYQREIDTIDSIAL